MKKYPPGTTEDDWKWYEKEREAFEKGMRDKEPPKGTKDYDNWLREYLMDAPNKPGYFRANND